MPEGIEEVDFEKIADEMRTLYNRGISMSRCDRMKIDRENERVELIEDTQWYKEDKDKAVHENVKKMMGSVLVLGMLSVSEKTEFRELIKYEKDFALEVKVTPQERESKIYRNIEQSLKSYKNGIFNRIKVNFSVYDLGGHNG
jgi:hypothetical protein